MAEQFLTIQSTLDDPEFDQIEVRLRKKVAGDPTSSFGVERAVLRWIADHIPSWAQHCIDNGIKTL
jgi:hypothetical protein